MLGLSNALFSSSSTEQRHSLTLDGTGDYLDVGVIDLDDGDVAFSCWVFLKEWTDYDCVISNRDQSSTRVGYQIRTNGNANQIELISDFGGTGYTTAATGIELYKWTHVYCDIDRSANQNIYINGVLQTTTDISSQSAVDMTTTTGFRVGRDSDGTNYSNMLVDEVAIFNAVLGSAKAKGIYNNGKPFDLNNNSPDGGYTESANLVAYWRMFDGPFDDKANGVVHDAHNPGFGAELVTNGDFDDDSGWTFTNSTTTEIEGSEAVITSGGANAFITTSISGTLGDVVKVTFDMSDEAGTGLAYVRIDGADIQTAGAWSEGITTVYYRLVSSGTLDLKFMTYAAGGNGFTLKNVSVKTLNGYPGIAATAPTFSTNTPDDQTMSNVLALDGVNDYLATQADSTLATRTYSFWMRSTSTTVNSGVFGHGAADHGSFHINPHFTGAHEDEPIIYLGADYYQYFEDTSAQDDGNWHHWAVYIDHSNIANCTVHVDGIALSVESTVASGGEADAWGGPLTIGWDGGSNYFNGDIDQFAVFDTLLGTDAADATYAIASLAGQMWEGGDTDIANWTAQGGNDQEVDDGAVKITASGEGTNWDDGSRINLYKTADGGYLNSDLIMGRTYKFTCEVKVGAGDTVKINLGEAISTDAITSTTYTTVTLYYTPMSGLAPAYYAYYPRLRFNEMNSDGEVWIKSISLIDTEARKNDLTQTIGNYDIDWKNNLINYWKMGDGASDEVGDGIVHDQISLGPELLSNGDFASGAGSWNLGTGWAVPSNAAVHTAHSNDGVHDNLSHALSTTYGVLEAGQTYRVQYTMSSTSGGDGSNYVSTNVGGYSQASERRLTDGTYEDYVTIKGPPYAAPQNYIYFSIYDSLTTTIDNISVREVTYAGYGADLAIDGGFDTDQAASTTGTYWITDADWVVDNGIATLSGTTDNRDLVNTTENLVQGKTYQANLDVTFTAGTGKLYISSAKLASNGGTYAEILSSSGSGNYTVYFVASNHVAGEHFNIRGKNTSGSTFTATVDNIVIKQLNGDPGMTTSGATIIKQPV